MRILSVMISACLVLASVGGFFLLTNDSANETDIDNPSPAIGPDDFSPCAITIGFDELPTPYIGLDYYGKPSFHYGDPVSDFYDAYGIYFQSDDIPVSAPGAPPISSPNVLLGGLPQWDGKPIVVTLDTPTRKVGAWTIDQGYYNSPAGNEVSMELYDESDNLLGSVDANPYQIPAIQFLAFESTAEISKIVFRELQRPGDLVDDFEIDDLIIERECDMNVSAEVDCDPDTLNLKSMGKWITCYIELPSGYDVLDINASTILLEDALQPELDPKYGFVKSEDGYIMDHDSDGIAERMVKFDRREVQILLAPGYHNVRLSGKLFSGIAFEGFSDTIRVIDP